MLSNSIRWVNEGYPGSCLDLAEELANQTPVRLDVLLSLTPSAVTSDQLVVPNKGEETKTNERVARSHSVGSIRDMANTEAERRILDMVAAGGEAALAPSPTRTITPSESPAQPKRKLEMGASTESVLGITSKKEKPTEALRNDPSRTILQEAMEEDLVIVEPTVHLPESPAKEAADEEQIKNLIAIEEMCDELLNEPTPSDVAVEPPPLPSPHSDVVSAAKSASPEKKKVLVKKKIVKPLQEPSGEDSTKPLAKKSPVKVIKKIIAKTKTSDMVESLAAISPDKEHAPILERKFSLPEESLKPTTERRKSRIFETAEKFQAMNSPTATLEKPKKIVIPGVSVGNFKKEFERKASLTSGTAVPSMVERRCMYEKRGSDSSGEHGTGEHSRKSSIGEPQSEPSTPTYAPDEQPKLLANVKPTSIESDREKEMTEFTNFSLKEARRSMENSIALLNQAKTESSKEVDQLCAKTEGVSVSEPTDSAAERLKKIRTAREIIGNAIPVGRAAGMGEWLVPLLSRIVVNTFKYRFTRYSQTTGAVWAQRSIGFGQCGSV